MLIPAQVAVKHDESEEKEKFALETPIVQGCWKVIAPDGREEVTYKPIPGFEHLWTGSEQKQGLPSVANAASPPPAPLPAAQSPGNKKVPQRRTRKRTRATVQDSSEDDNDLGDANIPDDAAYHFHIGDLDALRKFFRRRLDELTTKPVRPIVTAWLKLLEPKRLSVYGRYHKKLPKDQPPACTPPWWPHDVPYEEPSHLDKTCLLTLAVDIMLQHRPIDEVKRKESWVAKLRHAAQYAVETTPSDQFSSSKGSGFSKMMQERALSEILPSLFDIAQKHEDHVCQFQRCKDKELGMGGRALAPRKRHQTAKATSVPRIGSDEDASGVETDIDDTITPLYLQQEQDTQMPHNSHLQASRQDTFISVQTQEPRQPDTRAYMSTVTPNTSFEQSMHALHPADDMDLDVKVASSASYHSPLQAHCTLPSTPVQYLSVHPGYNSGNVEMLQNGSSFSNMQSPFAAVSTPSYDHSLHMFDVQYPLPPTGAVFNRNTGYPYDCDMFVGASPALGFFNGLPPAPHIRCHQQTSRH
ncbi:hypothetical protein GMOD_00009040 [Pyrenophora seminiperda CCB06]|uniref:Subtelomeric hrmA-associated cluster protein AFUB-079030/YDR124W-like helical bundle domain-containing protein n=1 Tax=Pyrenophora seminiperda CCB06 TaxID=1302712 RepID=A0A3M7MFJ4_9PLEO|nr:hypothetical protein GMOD_00009040 [Pyrenophora seminiperda CCB06]